MQVLCQCNLINGMKGSIIFLREKFTLIACSQCTRKIGDQALPVCYVFIIHICHKKIMYTCISYKCICTSECAYEEILKNEKTSETWSGDEINWLLLEICFTLWGSSKRDESQNEYLAISSNKGGPCLGCPIWWETTKWSSFKERDQSWHILILKLLYKVPNTIYPFSTIENHKYLETRVLKKEKF